MKCWANITCINWVTQHGVKGNKIFFKTLYQIINQDSNRTYCNLLERSVIVVPVVALWEVVLAGFDFYLCSLVM